MTIAGVKIQTVATAPDLLKAAGTYATNFADERAILRNNDRDIARSEKLFLKIVAKIFRGLKIFRSHPLSVKASTR